MPFEALKLLTDAIVDGDQAGAVAYGKQLLDEGVSKETVVSDGLENAMKQLDAKCTVEQFNLLEIMLSGRAVMAVINVLFADSPSWSGKATVVLACPEGDVHDLGKNIVKMILMASGYKVIDCGKNCLIDKLVDSVENEKADAVAISGLITTVVPVVRQVRENLEKRGLGHVRLIAGGGALKQISPEFLNVDYVGESAFDAVKYFDENLLGIV